MSYALAPVRSVSELTVGAALVRRASSRGPRMADRQSISRYEEPGRPRRAERFQYRRCPTINVE